MTILHDFVATNPSESERAAFFNAVVDQVIAPVHQSVFWGDRMLTLDKARAFMSDPLFSECLNAIRGSHQYDNYSAIDRIAWRLNILLWAARCGLVQGGDLVECGVFRGDMAWVLATMLGSAIAGRTFYLYDSFEGFSPELSLPEDFPDDPNFRDFANNIYRESGLYDRVVARFSSMPYVRVIRGFLPQSLDATAPAQIGFIHIDLNSARAELSVLERLFDRVVPGGMIVFDDYGWHFFRRQRKLEDQFMEMRGHTILELPTGQGLVVKH